jgi:hypothetical protein
MRIPLLRNGDSLTPPHFRDSLGWGSSDTNRPARGPSIPTAARCTSQRNHRATTAVIVPLNLRI